MQPLLHKAVYCMEMTGIAGKSSEYSERPCFRGDRLPFAQVLPIKNRQIQGNCKYLTVRDLRPRSEGRRTCQRTIRPNRRTPGFSRFTGHMFLVCAVFFDT